MHMPLTQFITSINSNRLSPVAVHISPPLFSIISLNYISVIMFYHNFYLLFTLVVGIGPYSSPALYDTILNMCVIPNVDIIQNDGILDIAVITDVRLLEDYGIFYLAIYNTSTGDQAVLDACPYIIFGRR